MSVLKLLNRDINFYVAVKQSTNEVRQRAGY